MQFIYVLCNNEETLVLASYINNLIIYVYIIVTLTLIYICRNICDDIVKIYNNTYVKKVPHLLAHINSLFTLIFTFAYLYYEYPCFQQVKYARRSRCITCVACTTQDATGVLNSPPEMSKPIASRLVRV